jgi:hypothetical protein
LLESAGAAGAGVGDAGVAGAAPEGEEGALEDGAAGAGAVDAGGVALAFGAAGSFFWHAASASAAATVAAMRSVRFILVLLSIGVREGEG